MKKLLFAAAFCMFGYAGQAAPITIVSFNAENLFDTADDPDNPHDNTYLSLAEKQADAESHRALCELLNPSPGFFRTQCLTLNWDDATYSAKLEQYASVLLAMPVMPDVIVIPETENKKVLDDLVSRHLAGQGFGVIQLDTSDEPTSRGIDVGILTKLPIIGDPKAHKVDFGSATEDCGATRDIVQVALRLPDGDTLNLFGVHFPSGGNPLECRIRAFKVLNELATALPQGELSIAAGDFNFNCGETQTDAMDRLLQRGNWYLSPVAKAGCSAPGSSKFVDGVLYNWNTWSFLDLILASSSLSPTQASAKNWFADLGSFGTLVVNPEQIMVDEDDKGFVEPRRFDPVSRRGVSDHWPVGIRLLNRRG